MVETLINIAVWTVLGFLLFTTAAIIYGVYINYIKKPDKNRAEREDKLIAWADKIGIENYRSYHSPYDQRMVSRGIPRDRKTLRIMAELGLWAMSDGRGHRESAVITALPNEIDAMNNLMIINVGDNALGTLPEEIANLKHLQWLYINNNRLITLPENITRLKLKALDIRGNPDLQLNNRQILWLTSGFTLSCDQEQAERFNLEFKN